MPGSGPKGGDSRQQASADLAVLTEKTDIQQVSNQWYLTRYNLQLLKIIASESLICIKIPLELVNLKFLVQYGWGRASRSALLTSSSDGDYCYRTTLSSNPLIL
jgi:hypothetical protein